MMKSKFSVLAFLASLVMTAVLFVAPASAAPITCSGGQTATKTDTGWECINNGGNPTGSARHQGTGDKV